MLAERLDAGDGEGATRNLRGATFETAVINKGITEGHDLLAHAVLMLEVDDRGGMRFREDLEEANVEAPFQSFFILHQRRELEVVADKDECSSHTNGA